MSGTNQVKSVTLVVELASGDRHELVVREPSPGGGNPRFMAQQIAFALRELDVRADALLATYADQIRSA